MTRIRLTPLRAGACALAAMLVASLAYAQPHRDRREYERERYHTPHWVYDDRFHHNHYYPALGYSVTLLPAGNIALTFRGGRFFFGAGVWYQGRGPGYVVVRPPVGIVVPVLPPAYSAVWIAGVPYYYANDVYYVQAPGGYAVAQPPLETAPVQEQAPPPPADAPQASPAPGSPPASNWYYCDSARAYYPYVKECKESWRAVPATPPAPR